MPRCRCLFFSCFLLLCAFAFTQGCTGTGAQKQDEGNIRQEPEKLSASWTEVARLPIFDRTGMVLAMSEKSLSVFVSSARPGPWIADVCQILGLDPYEVSSKLANVSGMVCLSKDATLAQVQSLKHRGIKGLKIYQGYQRRYPYGSMAAPVLGLVDSRGMGVAGVESAYNVFLTRTTGSAASQKGFEGLVLCIEKDLQIAAEKELARQMHRLRAKKGCLVFMDMSSGDILAMASLPGWNPARYWEYDPSIRRNIAITDSWNPVLLFPVLAKVLDGSERQHKNLHESGGKTGLVKTSGMLKWGWAELSDRISMWSPWAQQDAGVDVNLKKVLGKLYSLGLGRPTGIDLPDEKIGGLPTNLPETWTEIEGLRASPMQMLRAFSVLAGGGPMVVPHLAIKPSGPAKTAGGQGNGDLKWLETEGVLSFQKELSFRRRPYLISVCQQDDKGGKESFQVVLMGFWPCRHPRMAYILGLDQAARDPRKARGTFRHTLRLADRARSLVFFAKGEKKKNKARFVGKGDRMPDLQGLTMRQAYKILRDLDIQVRIKGTGRVIDQRPAAGASIKNLKFCTIICKGMEV